VNLDFAQTWKVRHPMVIYWKGCILSHAWVVVSQKLHFSDGKC